MKTSKKLLSLLLVAIMLVSAIPFQALAASAVVAVKVNVNGEHVGDITTTGTITESELAAWLGEGDPLDAATAAAVAAVCPWDVATKGRVINLTVGSTGSEGQGGGSEGGSETPTRSTVKVYVNEVLKKEIADVSSITYEQCLAYGGVNTETHTVKAFSFIIGGGATNALAPGGTITVTADTNVYITTEAKGTTPPPATAFSVTIHVNGSQVKVLENLSSITYEQCLLQGNVNTSTHNVTSFTYSINGAAPQNLAAGGTINVTAATGVYITTEAKNTQGTTTPTKYTVYVDYTDGSEGEAARRYEMVEGQRFGDRLPANPLRGGMTFMYWYYAGTNVRVDADDTFDPANGTTIKAKWNISSFFLTLDENRQGEEYVNYGTRISIGDDLWAAVNKFDDPVRNGYVFMGWSLNGKIIKPGDTYQYPDDATAYAVWELAMNNGQPIPPQKDGKVYLEIYLNGKYGELAKRVDITSYGADGKITRAEVQKIVTKYYGPKAGYRLGYEGLFNEESWYWYTRDPETNGAESLIFNGYDDLYVFVMVKNVKVAYADPTNPKTGDYVLTTGLTLMAVSGMAAAAVYVTGKKRK